MVYREDTLEPLHGLTKQGEETFRRILELKADEILFRHKHPVKYWMQRFMNWIAFGDSAWTGAHCSGKGTYRDGFSYTGQA